MPHFSYIISPEEKPIVRQFSDSNLGKEERIDEGITMQMASASAQGKYKPAAALLY